MICDVGASYAEDKIVAEKIASNEDIEEIRNKQKDRIQKQTIRKPTVESRANIVAIAVATPLPPLKFRYIG